MHTMNDLLAATLEAHGGLDRWIAHERVDATIVNGGGFLPLKGVNQDAQPRRVSIWLHEQRAVIEPYGAPDQRTVFTPERVTIEKLDGTVVSQRHAPHDSFTGHQMNTPWDPLHGAYFCGETLWTYLTTPFVLAMGGLHVEEAEPWREGDETWRCLRAHFPASVETHSQLQDFYFGEDLRLRRHDYRVNLAGGFAAAQLVSHYVEVDGLMLPTRRCAYPRAPDGQPVREMLMLHIELSEIAFS
jgi:hypothetical protein